MPCLFRIICDGSKDNWQPCSYSACCCLPVRLAEAQNTAGQQPSSRLLVDSQGTQFGPEMKDADFGISLPIVEKSCDRVRSLHVLCGRCSWSIPRRLSRPQEQSGTGTVNYQHFSKRVGKALAVSKAAS